MIQSKSSQNFETIFTFLQAGKNFLSLLIITILLAFFNYYFLQSIKRTTLQVYSSYHVNKKTIAKQAKQTISQENHKSKDTTYLKNSKHQSAQ